MKWHTRPKPLGHYDNYYEKTQWVSATDANGHLPGLMVLDYNGNGQIETRDILNLGGNAGQTGNLANDATQATANAALQRNNVEWLDANGDHLLDKKDLASLKIISINFQTGEVDQSGTTRWDTMPDATFEQDALTSATGVTSLKCYPFDSALRIPHKGQRNFSNQSANSPVLGIGASSLTE